MVIDNRTMDARPTNGPNRTQSSTRQQRRRDRPIDQREHCHRQENNEGETDLRTNQNTVIDNRTMDARPTYGPIRTRSCTEQWMRDRLTDQPEHGHRQENNGGETNLRTNQNTVMHNRTSETSPTKDQLEQGHAQ